MRFQGIKSVIAVGQYIILYLVFVILLHKTVKCPGGKLGVLHNDTKHLLKALSQRANQKYENVRDAFRLELEKLSAYTVVSQLREYIPEEKWIGGMKQ